MPPKKKRGKRDKPTGQDVQAMRRGLIAQGYHPGEVNRLVSPSRTFEEIAEAVAEMLADGEEG